MSLSLREALQLALDPNADLAQRRQVIRSLLQLQRTDITAALQDKLLDESDGEIRRLLNPGLPEKPFELATTRGLEFPDLPDDYSPTTIVSESTSLPAHSVSEVNLALTVGPGKILPDDNDCKVDNQANSGDCAPPVLEVSPTSADMDLTVLIQGQLIPFEPRDIIPRCMHLYQQHIISFTLLGIIWTLPGIATLFLLLPMFSGVSGDDPGSFGAMVVGGVLAGAGIFALASSFTGSLLACWLYNAHVLELGWQPFKGLLNLLPRLPALLSLGFKRMLRLIGMLILFLMANGAFCSVIDLDMSTPLGRLQRDITLSLLALVFLWGLLRYSFAETLLVVEGLSAHDALRRSASFVSQPLRNFINLGMLFLAFQILLYLILGSTLTLMEFAPVSPQVTFIVLILSVATLEQAALTIFPLLYIDFKRGDKQAGQPVVEEPESAPAVMVEAEA